MVGYVMLHCMVFCWLDKHYPSSMISAYICNILKFVMKCMCSVWSAKALHGIDLLLNQLLLSKILVT